MYSAGHEPALQCAAHPQATGLPVSALGLTPGGCWVDLHLNRAGLAPGCQECVVGLLLSGVSVAVMPAAQVFSAFLMQDPQQQEQQHPCLEQQQREMQEALLLQQQAAQQQKQQQPQLPTRTGSRDDPIDLSDSQQQQQEAEEEPSEGDPGYPFIISDDPAESDTAGEAPSGMAAGPSKIPRQPGTTTTLAR